MTSEFYEVRLAYATDIHLNFLSREKIKKFSQDILSESPSLVVVTGDISEAPTLSNHLLCLEADLGDVPLFFVCGNHDYYNGSIEAVRESLKNSYAYPDYEKEPRNFRRGTYWLGASGIIPLTSKTALIGHDGWYDGLYANWMKSKLDMNDYYCIEELVKCGPRPLILQKLRELATISANYVREHLVAAFKSDYKTVYVATHVPPFRENSTYKGKISDDDWMPSFSSKIMGDMLIEVMKEHADKHCVVLCGHSHGGAHHQALKNLECYTGEAEYRFPKLNEIFIVE